MEERKQYGMKLRTALIDAADAALSPGQSRTAFVEAAIELLLEERANPRRVPDRAPLRAVSGEARIVPRPTEPAYDPNRLHMTSREAKAGIFPVGWKPGGDAA